jgi:hypothetical protein
MVFRDFAVGQAGVFQPEGTDYCTWKYLTFTNLSRGYNSDQPYKSWCFYNAVSLNDHQSIDHCTFAAPAVSRDMSAIQWDSSGSAGVVAVTNCAFTNYHYVIYNSRPTSDITLDSLTLSNCGRSSTPASIRFVGAVAQAGRYSNITATNSDPYLDEHTGGGTIANAGGNSGI